MSQSYGRVPPSTYSGVMVDYPMPNSLAPMAMSADASGSQRISPTVVIRERSSVKTGIGILAIGALVGALLGVGMRVHQNGAGDSTATAAVAPNEAVPVPVFATPAPQAAPQAAPAQPQPVAAATTPAKTTTKDSAKDGSKKNKARFVPAAPHTVVAASVPEAPPPAPPVVKEPKVAKAPAEPKEAKDSKKGAASAETAAAVDALKKAQGEADFSLSGGK